MSYANAGAHNCIYRGKSLGTSVTTDQHSAISEGTFDDMYIGDYWTINSVVYRIAAFDYWYNSGDTNCTTHHVLLVPDSNLYSAQMNSSATTDGGYIGSEMYTTNLADAITTITSAFGSDYLLTHREFLVNAVTNGYPSGGAWYDSTVELMNEQMVYGGKILEPSANGTAIYTNHTIDKSQLPLFQFRHDLICNRSAWWLRSVVSSTTFAYFNAQGRADAASASYSLGVRPAFAIT